MVENNSSWTHDTLVIQPQYSNIIRKMDNILKHLKVKLECKLLFTQ